MTDLLTETFTDPQGRFDRYDAYDPGQLAQVLGHQRHVDVRTFIQGNDVVNPHSMLLFDQLTMTDLDFFTMAQLDDVNSLPGNFAILLPGEVVHAGERWNLTGSGGITGVGPDSARNYWSTLRVDLVAGSCEVSSPYQLVPGTPPVDVSEMEDDADLSVTLPSFPLASVDVDNTFLDVGYDEDATFTTHYDSFAFADSDVPLVAGNSEFRVKLSELTGDQITAVRFRITATGTATMKVAAIRVLPVDWSYGPYTVDTLNGLLRPTVSRTGLTTQPFDYPWPILWRSTVPSGSRDPRPIDVSLSTIIRTGSLSVDGVSSANRVALYLREITQDFMTQLDLDGMTMEELDALGAQPDVGAARYRSRTQSELQGLLQSQLQGQIQFDLERAPDELASSWIRVALNWGSDLSTLAVDNSEGAGYSWTSDQVQAHTRYVILVDLEGNQMRVRVHPLGSDDKADTSVVIFDSTLVVDDGLLVRRQGRVGWEASLVDGDAMLEEVRSRGVTYAEWESSPFQSKVPVDGARLTVQASPDRTLYTGIEPVTLGPEVIPTTYFDLDTDHDRTLSGESFRVTNSGNGAPWGIQTNRLAIEDFEQTAVGFSVWYPTTSVGLYAYLRSTTGRTFSLDLPRLARDQWQDVRLDLSGLREELTGDYRLLLLQHDVGTPTTWWLDQVDVRSRTMSWAARSVLADPWGDSEAVYTGFGDLVNQAEAGVLFPERGNFLQVRGRAHSQDAWIDQVQFKPRYAQLGRLVWPGDEVAPPTPDAAFSSSISGGVVTFDGTASTVASGRVASYDWSLGDGERRFGAVVTHDYAVSDSYTVTLTVTSDRGVVDSVTHVVAG